MGSDGKVRLKEHDVVQVGAVPNRIARHAVAEGRRARLDFVGRRVRYEYAVPHIKPEDLVDLRSDVRVQIEHATFIAEW